MKTGSILLSVLLKATSNRNVLKYSDDADRKKHARGEIVGPVVLYIMLLAYCISISIGYGQAGLTAAIPQTTVLTISLVGFFLTLFKTNGYMFNFKEYDLLMAMPIPVRTVVAAKFFYMYVKSLPLMVITSVSMLVGYGIYARPGFGGYLLWIVLSFVIPLMPMVAASALGALFAKIGSGFRHKNVVQTILIFVFVVSTVGLRFVLEAVFRNGETEAMIEDIAGVMDNIAHYYPPAVWFTRSITESSLLFALLMIAVSLALFFMFTAIVSSSYRQINSALSSGSAHKDYKKGALKTSNTVNAIAFKEFKRFMGSTVYLTNVGMGEVFVVLLGIAAIFFDADKMVSTIMQGAPLTKEMLMPAIPLIVYFCLGLVPSTCCSPSLEGKNYWIVQSMPISPMDLYHGKMRFNQLLTLPFMAFTTITLGISASASFIDIVLYLMCGAVLLIFSTCFGLRCGLKHIKLNWENEIEVVKQGAAVTTYLLPNMLVTMALIAGVVILSSIMNGRLVILIITLVAGLLAYLSYVSVKRMAVN